MNLKIIIVLPMLFILTGCPWDDKKTPANADKNTHDSFVGNAPATSKPYNVMDYAKPAPKP